MREYTTTLLLLTMLVLLLFNRAVFANAFQEAFQAGILAGKNKQMNPAQAAEKLDFKKTLKSYTENPSNLSQHYHGMAGTDGSLVAVAQKTALDNDLSQSIVKNFNERPHYHFSTKKGVIARNQWIQNHAVNIAQGISGDGVDCHWETKNCNTLYERKTCEMQVQKVRRCTQSVDVVMEDKLLPEVSQTFLMTMGEGDSLINKDFYLPATIQGRVLENAFISKMNFSLDSIDNCDSGTELFIKIKRNHQLFYQERFRLPYGHFELQRNIPIHQFVFQHDYIHSDNSMTNRAVSGQCSIGSVGFSLKYWITVTVPEKTIQVPTITYPIHCDVPETIQQKRSVLNAAPQCEEIEKVCVQQGGTRQIGDQSITQDCWQWRVNYRCGQSDLGDCKALEEAGCQMIDSQCQGNDPLCLFLHQTYQCPIQQCLDHKVVCGGNSFCITGDCTDQSYTPSPDFGEAVSALSVLGDMAKSFDEQTQQVFTGTPMQCRDLPLDAFNCCADTGWLKGLGFRCKDAEIKLGKAKEKKLTVEVGRYCAHEVAGVCVEHKKSYCTFASTMARMIQVQGRRQLHLNFNETDPEYPHCRGLTPEELQHLDFTTMDFSELYDELKARARGVDIEKIKRAIEAHTQSMIDNAGLNDD